MSARVGSDGWRACTQAGIVETLESVATSRGIVWEDKLNELKKAGQWHVELY